MVPKFPIDLDASLAPILATVLDAVVVMTTDGRVAGWNAVAERTFGWSWREAKDQYLSDLIVPEQHRKAHQHGLRRLASGGQPRVLNRRIEISAIYRDGREFPVELSITTAPTAAGRVFVGFIRDISDRREAEKKIERQALKNRLMFEISSMAAESESFELALRRALEAICEITRWPVGHAFIIPPGNLNALHSSDIWVEAEEGIASELRSATDAIAFGPGVGLPGEVLISGEPKWISNTDAEVNFPRKGSGFAGAFAFPIKCGGRVLAILEFFSRAEAPPEPGILLFVRALGEQVGRVFERQRTHDHRKLLVRELDHRVKNLLSVVQAVAQQTFRRSESIDKAYQIFRGRLIAIAQAQDVLVTQNSQGASLRKIIEGALGGAGVSSDRVTVGGPHIDISARNAVTISLAIHELCTNAFKYGALSTEDGAVSISWKVELGDEGSQFLFEWREVGGPRVVVPKHKGFGTNLLERGLAGELGGEIRLDYAPDGLTCVFKAPMPDNS